MIRIIFFVFTLLFTNILCAESDTENNNTLPEQSSQDINLMETSSVLRSDILLSQKEKLEKELNENNIWFKIYSNYDTYQQLKEEEALLDAKIRVFKKRYKATEKQKAELEELDRKKATLVGKLQLLGEYEKDPFNKLLTPAAIEEIPTVTNPFSVIEAISYLKKLHSDETEYKSRYASLNNIVEELKEKEKVLQELIVISKDNAIFQEELLAVQDKIKIFTPVLEIFKTTQNVYTKKIDEINLNLQNDIKKEGEKAIDIAVVILFFVLFIFFIKYLVRRYMSDNDRFYTINKAINITFFTLLLFTLLFAYIENVSYLVTILGFASAGIAIAMKDWFMSLMGWFVIIIGGSVHVGDRVKFVRGNVEYVGDIVDISLLRMTIQEDITLTTIMQNRRAGRIIFVPNNFIFTDMLANYTHAGLKTVWDGIDFMITFDSNISKASSIAKEITKKYSKGYTDITRKQLNKLRNQYSMKNTNVEPRIYTFIEPYGIKISAWYHTNAYATLTLRSTISLEIITRIQAESDIFLAFPTQSIYVDKDVRKPAQNLNHIVEQGEKI